MTLPALQNSSVFFRKILSQFPQDISLAFAYGSAVFRQTGSSQGQMTRNMLDFVFAVDDPVTWHTMNLMENRKHYSFLRFLGPKHISNIQSEYGAGVYFNTLIPADDRVMKYGVISTDALIDDLLHWKTLYVAGRLHKPVRILLQNENGKLRDALVGNLKSAVIASFLMLPESCSEEDLFLQIAGLSYSGGQKPRGSVHAAHGSSTHPSAADHASGGPSGEEQGCGGDPPAGGAGPRLWLRRTARNFIDSENLQPNTECQRNRHRWSRQNGVVQRKKDAENVERLA
ncbi:phosphatidate cytidylyltransferase, mitochondrial isoform X2 [Chanodichthys erythropterus]|uniref:phosphatidate cytidylyltransferase, mitochondrial isoform X2 n=1 Tax=Chanodichthys erythropterus TaxID=933992 RepID=UPI00351E4512